MCVCVSVWGSFSEGGISIATFKRGVLSSTVRKGGHCLHCAVSHSGKIPAGLFAERCFSVANQHRSCSLLGRLAPRPRLALARVFLGSAVPGSDVTGQNGRMCGRGMQI